MKLTQTSPCGKALIVNFVTTPCSRRSAFIGSRPKYSTYEIVEATLVDSVVSFDSYPFDVRPYLKSPEEVGVRPLSHGGKLAAWEHQVKRNDIVDRQTTLIREPRIPYRKEVEYNTVSNAPMMLVANQMGSPPPNVKPATPTPVTRPPTTLIP